VLAAPPSAEGPEPDAAEPEAADGIRTRAGSVLGTAAYMAPEQARGRIAEVDRRSDVFGLGGMLCRILSGEPPYTGPSAETIRRRAAEADLDEARARLHGCGADPELVQLTVHCLAPRKADRPADAGAVAARLAAYQTGVQERLRQAELERAAAQAAAAAEGTARRRTRALAVAVMALVALAAGGGLWAQHQAAERRAERSRQESALRQEVAADLDQAVRFRQGGHFDASRELLEQDRQRLADSGPDDLRTQVEHCLADTVLTQRLDGGRQRAASWEEGKLDLAGAERGYAAALAEAGLGQEGDEPEKVGARVRASAVRAEVVAALDDWAGVTSDDARRSWLLAAARAADPDPERDRLRRPEVWQNQEALMRLNKLKVWQDQEGLMRPSQRPEAAHLPPSLAIALARPLMRSGNHWRAVPLLRAAQAQRPDDFWINATLAGALDDANQPDEAVAYYRAALALRPRSATVHRSIATVLCTRGQVEEAIDHYQEALRLQPGDIGTLFNLGKALTRNGQLEAALRSFEEAVRLKPAEGVTHSALAAALARGGQGEAAMRHYEEALRLNPRISGPHSGLGILLYNRGRRDEAIRHYEEALRLRPNNEEAHHYLGDALRDRGDVEAAVRHYEEALRIDPRDAAAHYSLGNVLFDRGELEAAVRHYEEVVRIDPKHAEAHCHLGNELLRQGRFREALFHLREGHELGSKQPGWAYPSEQWVQHARLLLVRDRKLSAILWGEAKSVDAVEQLDLAEVCVIHKRYAAAARFAADAFAARPQLAEDLQAGYRYRAVCAAVLAGCGRGRGAAVLDDSEKARFRRQALDWFGAGLALRAKQLSRDRRATEKALRQWLKDPALADVRDPEALAHLPEAERREWRSLWQQLKRLVGEAAK
jgi:serine/threonine-protein kinase